MKADQLREALWQLIEDQPPGDLEMAVVVFSTDGKYMGTVTSTDDDALLEHSIAHYLKRIRSGAHRRNRVAVTP